MTTARYFLRDARDPALPDCIPFSTTPAAGTVQVGQADAQIPISFVALFWENAVAVAQTDHVLTGPIASGRFLIPSGYNARIYKLAMWTVTAGGGFDMTAATANLYVGGTDASASFGALTLDPSQDASANAVPLSSPYVISGSATSAIGINVKVTTNGTSGTLGMLVHVYGYMYPIA